MELGTIELTYTVSCKWCNKDCRAGTLKKAYKKLIWHARMCENVPTPPSLFQVLKAQWEMIWWKDPTQ